MSTAAPHWISHELVVDDARTHVLEAGDQHAPHLVLIHYGGHGATVEEAWEHTIGPLAEHFHILAPEQLGFGRSAKVFDFADTLGARVRHINRVLELFGVREADFMAVSTAATMTLGVAAESHPLWPIRRIVGVGAVGPRAGGSEVKAALRAFDGTPETMDDVIATAYAERWWDGQYTERRLRAARAPGAWQCVAAEQLQPPWAPDTPPALASDEGVAYERIACPVLLVSGALDKLRRLDALADRAARIPDCRVSVLPGAGHFAHIERAATFNELALRFLLSPSLERFDEWLDETGAQPAAES